MAKPKAPTKIQRALAGETIMPPPVWFLRQAGRYLPEYRAVRKSCGGFLDLCLNPELSSEVTMQPIRRFDFDAAILFSDILIVPHILGQKVWFEEGEGPRLLPINDWASFKQMLSLSGIDDRMAPVLKTVELIRDELPRDKSLIGFAGSPWTVATYMIAGRGKDDQIHAKALMRGDADLFDELMTMIERATVKYLSYQVRSGVDIIMLFDSWAGALADDNEIFEKYCYKANYRIAEAVRSEHPHVRTIYFPRGATADQLSRMLEAATFSCIALGEDVDVGALPVSKESRCCLQGNLDPSALSDPLADIAQLVRDNVAAYGSRPHIFNLGHGITPTGRISHVETALRTLRALGKDLA